MTVETLYKVTGPNGEACHGGTGLWHLPKGKRPGKWMPAIPNPQACHSGYHVVRLDQLPDWLGRRVWTVEVRGTVIDDGDKLVAEQARLLAPTLLDERRARLFAADCAERVLHIYERESTDRRPRAAIDMARKFANGEASAQELAAAGDAAGDAAGAAAGDAARAAAGAAARAATWAAARDAARAATWAAARDAARDAAWDAEQAWQRGRLLEYLHDEIVSPLVLP